MKTGERQHLLRVELVARALERAALEPGAPFDCPYLPQRTARYALLSAARLPPGAYHVLLDLNFRRLGSVCYRPQCEACDACRMLRLDAEAFRPTRAQRRCLKRNADLAVDLGPPEPSDEKYALYRRYLDARHDDGRMEGSREEFEELLYRAPPSAFELSFRLEGRLVGVGLADAEPRALSAVYCYFDPDEAPRSPGVLNVLRLVEECRRRRVPWLYLGYHVEGCRKMAYKAGFHPHEVRQPDGRFLASSTPGAVELDRP